MRRSEALNTTSSNAVPDVVFTSPMPTDLKKQLRHLMATDYEVTSEAHWSGTDDPANANLLFGAVEYKHFEEAVAYGHLVYDLSTAQSVRKALGLNDETLYGWTSVKAGQDLKMILYASWRVSQQFCSLARHVLSCR